MIGHIFDTMSLASTNILWKWNKIKHDRLFIRLHTKDVFGYEVFFNKGLKTFNMSIRYILGNIFV